MQNRIELNICMSCMRMLPGAQQICPHCGANNSEIHNPSHQLEIKSILRGRYLVGRSLGQGGFGITYMGYDLVLDMRVAIKEYYPEGFVCRHPTQTPQHSQVLVNDGNKHDQFVKGRESFLQEARVLAKLKTLSNVVQVNDFFQDNGTAYIVMEYVEGETLKKRLQRNNNKLPAAEVLELLNPVMDSLGQIHKMGLLHRDISPDNIIIREDGSAVLLDFGAAVDIQEAMEHSIALNVKHGFAPVEQYVQHSNLGPWSDVYAMSATIYRALTGRMPPQAVERANGGATLIPPRKIGADITAKQERALVQGLTIYAKDRIQSMSELSERLKDTGGSHGSKKGLAIALACAVAAAGVGIAIWQPWNSGNAPAPVAQTEPAEITEAPTDAPTAAVTETPAVTPEAEATETVLAAITPVPDEKTDTVDRADNIFNEVGEMVPEMAETPSPQPTATPTAVPTEAPTPVPTEVPTEEPTEEPTVEPTAEPTAEPTEAPTPTPTPTPVPGWADGAVETKSKQALIDLGYKFLTNAEGLTYCITKEEMEERGALLAEYKNNTFEDGVLVVPDAVQYQGEDYPVIALCDDFLPVGAQVQYLYIPGTVQYLSVGLKEHHPNLIIGTDEGSVAMQAATALGFATVPDREPPQKEDTPPATSSATSVEDSDEGKKEAEEAENKEEEPQKQVLEAPVGQLWTWEETEEGLRLTAYHGSGTELIVPAEIDGKNVMSIALQDSDVLQNLQSLTVEDGVQILEGCLINCTNLKEVSLPASLKQIAPEALRGSPWLAEHGGLVVLEDGCLVRYSGDDDHVVVPGTVRAVGDNAFRGMAVKSLTIGEGVEEIGAAAFADMKELESISLPESVKVLAADCLTGTRELRMLSIGAKANTQLKIAAKQLAALRYVYLAEGVTLSSMGGAEGGIGSLAFLAAEHTMAKPLTDAGFTVVEGAAQHESESVMKELGWFSQMEAVKATIGQTWSYEIDREMGTARITSYNSKVEKTVEVPPTVSVEGKQYIVTEIGPGVLSNSAALEEVSLPSTLVRIGENAFSGCGNLATVKWEVSSYPVMEAGVLRGSKWLNNKAMLVDNGTLLMVKKDGKALNLAERNDIIAIAPYALYGTDYTRVTLPETVGEIGLLGLSGMVKLDKFEPGSHLKKLGALALAGCTSLKTVTVPDGMEEIGCGALADSQALMRVELPDSIRKVGGGVMSGSEGKVYGKAEGAEHQETWTEKNGSVFLIDYITDEASLIRLPEKGKPVIPDQVNNRPVTAIAADAGKDTKVDAVTVPGTVKALAGFPQDMPALTTVILKDGVESVDDACFRNCPKLKNMTLPASLTGLPRTVPEGKIYYTVKKDSPAHLWLQELGIKPRIN